MSDLNTRKHIDEILDFIKVKIDMLEEELLTNPININNLDEIIENGNKAVRIDELKRVFEFIRSVQDEYIEMDIVHCKDCKHWGTGVAGELENVKCCEYGKYMIGANGYCVFGEKRSVQNEINRC